MGERLDDQEQKTAAPGYGRVELDPFDSRVCLVPEDLVLRAGDEVVIRDDEGEELGRYLSAADAEETDCRILRLASEQDQGVHRELDRRAGEAKRVFSRLANEMRLNAKPVHVHWRFDRHRVLFYLVSEERRDFRPLQRALASTINARVTIRQVGARDHARMLGGVGVCGRELCCRTFLRELRGVSLRMARQQSLFVEPAKISGLCGKLQCCLGYEDETYRQLILAMPRIGTWVMTERGRGVVTSVDVLTRRVRVRYRDETELSVAVEDLKGVRTGKSDSDVMPADNDGENES